MKLQLYFARKFLMILIGIFAVFAIFLTLLDMVDQMRRFDSAELSFGGALQLSLLAAPETLYAMLPLMVMLATLALFLGLARTSELVVTRAAGRSAIRAMIAPAITAALVGVFGVTVLNPIVAATKHGYERRAAELSGSGNSVLSVSREGLWLRQGGEEGQTVIRAQRANLDGTVLYGVTFIGFAPEGAGATGAVRRAEAESATLVDGAWKLTGAKLWPLTVENPEAEASLHDEVLLPSTLTQTQIRDSFGSPASVPIWELPAFIADLDTAGFSARLHRVWFQMELALPLFLASMVMIGAGFTMRHTRFGRTGLMVLLALMMGFGAFFIRNFAQVLGQNGDIPISLAAWAPPAAAILMSMGLLLHLEDG
ncbi:LPS export ABC transporter permease LptG [Tropicimonas isoalkanivorans]|uniref:Lipopolysaccharide export system permease protein n=1 Tax=Tropicimonas isoalkanivorans TaxID=441112 RepID=A0A1I1DV37_9RHOB|nr:LPS export ABC transporter permease LptG [Tropicimonas isoalkanivorans]SFB78741.1 lipopolysaccharide export system permease protein [Tropicimonas isoalkanivorans]